MERIDPAIGRQRRSFLDLPSRLYRGNPQWVPPMRDDAALVFDRRRHPFYEHSDAEFFVARRGGRVVGRIAALENRPYNVAHRSRTAHFYLFDAEDDPEIAAALFTKVREWARSRGLDEVMGPMGFGPMDGHGLLVEGFQHRQMMSVTAYNHPYYVDLVEGQGFEPTMDFLSFYAERGTFAPPEQTERVARRALARGTLQVRLVRSAREGRSWALKLGDVYNRALVDNPIYYPLSEREILVVLDAVARLGDSQLVLILDRDEVVGFLLIVPDLSAGIQRTGGRLWPFGFVRLLLERRRTRWASFLALGVLPGYRVRGAEALLYTEAQRAMEGSRFQFFELTQNADTSVLMRRELLKTGAVPYKRHRVYRRSA